jgi:MarR family 2-MHQ and catechol resistance regulon transcriptional repressor
MAKKNKPNANLAAELGKREPFSSLRQETYINLIRTHERLTTEFAHLFKEHGLSDSQYNVLRILRGEGVPMQIYQIAERLIFAQADISRLVERLHTAGLIARERCADDRRVVWITLTDKATAVLKKLDRPLKRLHESQFTDLSERELKTLNDLLFRARPASDKTLQ